MPRLSLHPLQDASTMRRTVFFLLVGIVSLGLVGCDGINSGDLTENLNENPNASTEPSVNNLLANGQEVIAFNWFGDDPTMRGSNLLAQYTTQNQFTDESFFRLDPRIGFGNFYNGLNDIETAKQLAREQGATATGLNTEQQAQNAVAVAMVHQVWTFQLLTDLYGSIPFEEALQEADNPSPVYTPQQDIYPALVDSLDAALNLMDPGAPGPSGDLVYDGDMEKWQKFANSLKMRVGMRMSDSAPQEAQDAVTSAVGNAFEGVDDSAFFGFLTSPQNRSTIFENRFVSGRNDFDASDRFVNILTQNYGVLDPRSSTYFTRATDNPDRTFNGFPYGLAPPEAGALKNRNTDAFFSRSGPPFVTDDAQAPMMLYDEVLFVKAEAADKGWIGGDRRQFLREGIRASIRQWNPDTSDVLKTRYVDAVVDDISEDGFEQILGEQKWIALYFQGVQGWSEWRRLDFEGFIREPEGGFAGEAGGQTTVPVRLDYPDREFQTNEENVRDALEQQFGSDQGTDHFGNRLWWDTEQPPPGALP